MMGKKVTWENGLTIPTAWYLKHSESAVTTEPFLESRLKVTIRLAAFSGENFKLPEWSPLPKKGAGLQNYVLDNYDDKDVIKITQRIKDLKTGLEVVNLNLYFYLGIGLIRADGRIFTTNVKYQLEAVEDQVDGFSLNEPTQDYQATGVDGV